MQTNTDIITDKNNKDVANYGEMGFPAESFEICLSKTPSKHYSIHWHDVLHVQYAQKGSMIKINTVKNSYTLKDYDTLFLNIGVLHSVDPIEGKESNFVATNFDRRIISSFAGSYIEQEWVMPFIRTDSFSEIMLRYNIPEHRKIIHHFINAHKAYIKKEYGYALIFTAEMMQAWRLLHYQKLMSSRKTSFKESIDLITVKQMLTFISENYSQDIRLIDITNAANISRSEGGKIFKNVTGQTPFIYLQRYRIDKSIELLLNTNDTMGSIAYETGFCNQSYFIQCFKKVIGYTPREYRNSITIK
ncbi:MAG: AraC family transcriptional regulator [Acidaminococcaceae bacterium]|nr:AraC family transcriptional regulator [Acidaminococcaceae bacterium]